MVIKLTNEQQRLIDATKGTPAEAVDPSGKKRYRLVPAEEYDALRDDQDQAALRQASLNNLAMRLKEEA